MNSVQRNRTIHLMGLLACTIALSMTAPDVVHGVATIPSLVAFVLAAIGAVGNVYGILRPSTWFR